jgi:hypothetical protein
MAHAQLRLRELVKLPQDRFTSSERAVYQVEYDLAAGDQRSTALIATVTQIVTDPSGYSIEISIGGNDFDIPPTVIAMEIELYVLEALRTLGGVGNAATVLRNTRWSIEKNIRIEFEPMTCSR